MKWSDIRKQHPGSFILIGDLVEERISEGRTRIAGGRILKVSANAKEVREAYQQYKQKGMEVLYSLPTTPEEFIVENVPFKGILR